MKYKIPSRPKETVKGYIENSYDCFDKVHGNFDTGRYNPNRGNLDTLARANTTDYPVLFTDDQDLISDQRRPLDHYS